jgi:phosphatidylserine/phosphatidylglycerophosphate/cardiolipin synthase-like enzyme
MRDVGIGVRRVKHQRLHAKVLLADKARAIVGSINFSASSFDDRRELAIHVKEATVVDRLTEVIHDDWEHSGLLDLDDRAVESGEEHEMKHNGQTKADSALDFAK